MLVDTSSFEKKEVYGLTTVMVNDFNDDYHRFDNEPSTELERSVRKIRRRYKSFSEYKKAMVIYFEYMDLLAEKYGGSKTFSMRLESGTVLEYIPACPKLKKNKLNDFIVNEKIMISDPQKLKSDNDLLVTLEEELYDSGVNDSVEISDRVVKVKDKEIKKIIKGGIKNNKLSINKIKEIDSIDLLESYFDNTSTKEGRKQKRRKNVSLSDIIDGKNPYEEDKDETVTFYHGRMVGRKELESLKLIEELGEYGWNPLQIMKSTTSKSSNIRNILEDKKDRDKALKKKKKAGKAADDFLLRAMGDNDYESFDAFEEDMLHASINDLFN